MVQKKLNSMKKLIGTKKLKISVFISGKGSNLENLIKFSKLKESKFKIDLIISSNSTAGGLKIAKRYNIRSKIYNFKNKKNSENKVLLDLSKRKIKLICLAGFMKVLSKNFINKFSGKILNIHPSLLPKYKGLNTHERVIRNNEKYSGCTVHLVNSKLDSGKILSQKIIRVYKKDNAKSLQKRILKEEHLLYRETLMKFFSKF